MSKRTLLKGTVILTIAGFLTRLIGFFYRIFLSNILGAENLGVYQLIFPIYGIAYNIYGTGIQTTISRFVATELGKKHYKNVPKILKIGLFLSTSVAIILSVIVFLNADFLATNVLLEPRSASSIKIMAVVFPFCGITACINGYYYGLTKPGIPATTQLVEQVIRVSLVYVIALYIGNGDLRLTTEFAVVGLVIGEVASNLYNMASLKITSPTRQVKRLARQSHIKAEHTSRIAKFMLKMSIPLTANRLLISILHSVEAILIPNMLKKYGLSTTEALSIYGIINGMAMPFIMFPSTLTNSLSVLLLPTISEAEATNNRRGIKKTTAVSVKYSLLIGILSLGLFLTFGQKLGSTVFHNTYAGKYLVILAWLCPLLYVTTTLSSIINGLGKVHLTFVSSVVGLSIRILLIVYLVPRNGISGYFLSLLISQLIMTAYDYITVYVEIKPSFDAVNCILKPSIIVALLGFILYRIYEYVTLTHGRLLVLLGFCGLLCVLYVILLVITNAASRKDFK